MWSMLVGKFQKGACRYLLHRYLGQYLKEKVTVDQLTVDLYNGTGSVTDVSLDCDALNSLAEQHNLPIEFIEGTLDEINFSVPWSNIMQDSCEIQIKGLKITIQPKNRTDNGSSMIDSMMLSMASSMQLAEECLKKCEEIEDDQDMGNQEIAGLEYCANTIDAVLSRVKISFQDTVVRVERCQKGSDIGVAVEFHINLWKYSDDSTNETSGSRASEQSQQVLDSAFSHKKITLEGVTCHSDIFNSKKHFERQQWLHTYGRDEDAEIDVPTNCVQVGKFSGLHEIKLQVKTDESMAGPQISVDCSFGSLIALLTPIQAHILYTLINEILDPVEDLGDRGPQRVSCSEKPMDVFDFRRVEEELQERLKPGSIGMQGLGQQQGWSSACYDESDDEFQPLKGRGMATSTGSNFMDASVMSNSSMNSSMHQSMTDSINLSTYKSAYNYSSSQQNSSAQPNLDKTKFSLSFASASVILLHEDMMSLSSSDSVLPDTLKKMQACSRKFFENLYYFGATVKGEKDISDVREKMNAACDRSHHRIIAAPLKFKGNIRNTASGTSETSGTLAVGYFELIESLKDKRTVSNASTPDPQCIEVLTFPRNFEQGNLQALKMDFKTESRKRRNSAVISKTSLKFHLSDCRGELDISIVDRINSLINSPLYFYMESKNIRNQIFMSSHQLPTKSQSIIRINVKCSSFLVDFRFPIPDLRPIEDNGRIPYWIRNIHNDSIVIQLKEVDFSTELSATLDCLHFDTKCHEVKLFYKKSPLDAPTLFGTAVADDPEMDAPSLRSHGLDWPRILVWIYPKLAPGSSTDGEMTEENENLDTMNFMTMPKTKPSPFSSKRVVHETDDQSEDETNNQERSESVIPGSRTEMGKFIDDTNKSVVYKVDLNFRFVEVSMPSKHFFEEIYNRVGNDLLLWEPSCIQPITSVIREKVAMRSQNLAFSMCKSTLKIESDSEDEEEMSAFYTPSAGASLKSGTKQVIKSNQSEVTFSLSIGKGIGSFYTPLQDTTGSTIPGQKGQITIKIEQGNLFVVSGYKGESNSGYLCLLANKAEMLHADFLRNGDILPRVCPDLIKTIYPSEDGMVPNRNSESVNNSDMLSVAIKIDRDPVKGIKLFKVATGIREGTLDHRIYLPNRNWFAQMTDFFDVTDAPVTGYTPSKVVTELHLHLWNCAVDYRPLNLPLRSVLTMDTFSISSNIAAQTSTSIMRFIAEDAAFFISSKPNSTTLREDYVCVLEMDYFELSLRLCTNRNIIAPRIDLSTSSNALHIRTCSDSFKALLELLTYYNNEGDLYDPNQKEFENFGPPYSPIKESSSEPALITTEEIIPEIGDRKLSVSNTEHVNDLVAEAMQDSTKSSSYPKTNEHITSSPSSSSSKTNNNPRPMYDLHFTPDFNSEFQYNSNTDFYAQYDDSINTTTTAFPNIPIMESSNGLPIDIQPSDEDEEEFCILENDPGVGIIPKNGESGIVKVLTNEPIRLIENYFAPPAGKMDALKAPAHYPNPVAKYSLKDMTIIWHMYGGDDFASSPSRKSSGKSDEKGSSETVYSDSWKEQQNLQNQNMYPDQSEVDIAIDALNPGAVFSKTKAFESAWEAYESPKSARKNLPEGCVSWRQQGGKCRRHDTLVELHLNRIKLVHEIYPETTEQASRQVILINSVEILDKLRTSQFNKMLYLYITPNRPKQTHANMVMVKAAHIRPDPQLSMEECCLKISVLPIRLNIDQDASLFLYQFFSELTIKSDSEDEDSFSGRVTNPPSHTPSVESLPVMTVNVGGDGNDSPSAVNMEGGGEEGSNLLMFNDDPFGMEDNVSTCSRDPSIDSSKSSSPVYFRQIIFAPEVPIRLDYRGKRVDMTHGPLPGLLMGLAQLNCCEIRLKNINHRHGVLGFDRLVAFLINEWAVDIKKNQLPNLLGGVGPIHSFVQLFQGVRDLFWLPIEQYQKDGRIAKGLQRGVNAFSTSTAMAALELANKLMQTIQGAAEFTYDMVSPGPSVQQKRRQSTRRRKRYNQPGDFREGMANAYNVVREGLGDTAQTLVRVASREHEQKGYSGAVGGVIRQLPSSVVQPIILVAEATSNILDGLRTQVEPEFKKENEEKWKGST